MSLVDAATEEGITPGNYLVGAGTLGQFGTPTAYLGAYQTTGGPLGGFTITYPDGTYATGLSVVIGVEDNEDGGTGEAPDRL